MIDLEALAESFGTPLYVYDLDRVDTAIADLRACLPQPHRLLYALKANPHPAVVRAAIDAGCGAEVSSEGELAVALDAGVDPAHIVLTGPAKSDALIATAVAARVGLVAVESIVELRRLRETPNSDDVGCLLRVNVDARITGRGLLMGGRPTPFGVDLSTVLALAPEVLATGATLRGLHIFSGSNFQSEETVTAVAAVAIEAASAAASAGLPVEVLDLGGGFAAPYGEAGTRARYDQFAVTIGTALDRAFPAWRRHAPTIVFEAGRYLVGDCGTLVTRVVDVKESKGERFVVVDAGVHHLGGLGSLTRMGGVVPYLLGGTSTADERVHVVGPLCTPLDRLAASASISGCVPGDVLAIPNVGAYGLTASLIGFLSHPAPAEVVLRGGVVESVSRLELVRSAAAAVSNG